MEIPAAIEQDFEIEVDDGKFNVSFRQATMGDDMVRASQFSERKTSRDEEGNIIEYYDLDFMKLAATEVRLTIVKCDLSAKKRKLFKAGMSVSEFMESWEKLPTKWADLIHEKCLEVNGEWSFRGARVSEETSSSASAKE